MIAIKAAIEGARPILLHSPAGMAAPSNGKKVIPTPEDEARSYLYWTDNKSSIALPSWNLLRSFIKAAAAWKIGKLSAANVLAGAVEFDPMMLSFNTVKYELHTCRAVVMGAGIMRTRPQLFPWRLEFTALADETCFQKREQIEVLAEIMRDAGRRVGVGDFRPEKKGPFGKFNLTKWELA